MPLAGATVIYGGSFNPPHLGHQMLALYLVEGLGAEAVWLCPAHRHPFGKELAPFELRVDMCRHAARPFGERVLVSEVERELGGEGRTFDLVQHLRAREPQRRFALAIGSDILDETAQWYRWRELTEMVEVVVVGRVGFPLPEDTPYPSVFLPHIASRDIRARVREGRSIEGLVPGSVRAVIEAEQLYRGPA